ncbi:MAG: hypothetical protein RL385_898 [Pseudomonadota bacterium]|jgi:hypothetical protein
MRASADAAYSKAPAPLHTRVTMMMERKRVLISVTCAMLLTTTALADETGRAAALPEDAIDVRVRARRSSTRRSSAEATDSVKVVPLESQKRRGATMADVLAREPGLRVQRSGGLGSYARLSMDGLVDEQIRYFLDGVPLAMSGYPFGIANVPVNLFERVMVYRGVLPVRLASDALGGAIDLITDDRPRTSASGSYERASYGTHRGTLSGSYRHDPSGLVLRASFFLDLTRNNYPIRAETTDATGEVRTDTVRRFHDHYRAQGGSVEAGVVDQPWARRLLVRVYHTTFDADLQHNRVMTIPYGEVTYGERVAGGSLRYENTFASGLVLSLVASHGRRRVDFNDQGTWVYDWYGARVRPRARAGEIDGDAKDNSIWENTTFARFFGEYPLYTHGVLRGSLSPTYATRTGDERIQVQPDARDPLTAKRDHFAAVAALSFELRALREEGASGADADRLRWESFLKSYTYAVRSEAVLPGGTFADRNQTRHVLGGGSAVRARILPWLSLKTAYELTTRIPTTDEIFGNGVLILENLHLEPETSHNINVGPRAELSHPVLGSLTAEAAFVVRRSRDMIALLGGDQFLTYQNVLDARTLGLDANLEWTSQGRFASLAAGLSYMDQRNISGEGTFAPMRGDRIPNRPYFTSSFGARFRIPKLIWAQDSLEPHYVGRHTQRFLRGWESQGARDSKAAIPTQLVHHVGIAYVLRAPQGSVSLSLDILNLTDARVYDLYGVQRPGRTYALKFSAEL